MGIGGAVGLSTAANIFLGMVEAPLFIRPYLAKLTRGELFMVMTGGMAGIAGTVFVLYATILRDVIPDVAGHILVASILGAPAALLISQLMVPVLASERTDIGRIEIAPVAGSTMDAIVRGTTSGLELLLNIVAMLIVLVTLVHLANAILSLLPDLAGAPITLQRMPGFAMSPVCWLMGVPWDQAFTAGTLMGIKTVLNEFIAYLELAKLPAAALDPRSRLIMLYAMCGFANFGSLGIMIAGLSVMAPERRADILSLGGKSIVSGTLTTCLMGAMVGVLN
jgi:CNT family concentrative nucleoside transporter